MSDQWMAILSGIFRALETIIGWGGPLFFLLISARYAFTKTRLDNDGYLLVMCLMFGIMVFFAEKERK